MVEKLYRVTCNECAEVVVLEGVADRGDLEYVLGQLGWGLWWSTERSAYQVKCREYALCPDCGGHGHH